MDDELRTLERAVAAAPGDLAAKVALARALDRAGRLVDAARLLDVSNAEGRALADDLWRRIVRRLRFAVASQGRNEVFVSGDGRLLWSSHEDAARALDDGRVVTRTEGVSRCYALERGLAWPLTAWGGEGLRLLRPGAGGFAEVDRPLAEPRPSADYVVGSTSTTISRTRGCS